MSDENVAPQTQAGTHQPSALTVPPRRKPVVAGFWKNKGRHVGRTIHAFANIAQLILAGIQFDKDLSLLPDNDIEKYPTEARFQYKIYTEVLRFLPQLEEEFAKDDNADELNEICVKIQAGASAARSDDVKGLKAAILDWIADPEAGLVPPIRSNQMSGRGFHHEATGQHLCPAGLDWNDPSTKTALEAGTMVVPSDQWPIFLYQNAEYHPDRPWIGLLRGHLLVKAFKHIFTSPSSVNDAGRSTKSSNAAMHGMTKVTPASITYVATLVRFVLGSRDTFSRTDTVMDSQNFYNVLLAFLTHPEERENVHDLLAWWDRQVFPYAVVLYKAPTVNSALAKLMEARTKRAALRAINQPY